MKKILLNLMVLFMCSCVEKQELNWVSTTPDSMFFQQEAIGSVASPNELESADIVVSSENLRQTVDGFGACFNELGWTSLSQLSAADRSDIFKELFGKERTNFTLCRMPIGANDFARDWYSYNETDKDFGMNDFSIANDEETLIPFIKSALDVNPDLYIWASPWCPPSWMKKNRNYACDYKSPEEFKEFVSQLRQTDRLTIDRFNDLTPEQEGLEGTDMFIQKTEYFKAYALYFRKFIEAYREKGIQVRMVAPQNEFNSCQVYPSCVWTSKGLNTFIGKYLGPEMKAIGVDIMLGTVERENVAMVDSIIQGDAMSYVSYVGFQWAGKPIIQKIAEKYPDKRMMQTESECGNGANDWDFCFYTWEQMKSCFNQGVTSYMYWNISLESNALSRWLWRQNSLVSVDIEKKEYHYTPEFYLMKHFSHFIQPGAKRLETQGSYGNVLAFINPDGEIVVLVVNEKDTQQKLTLEIDNRLFEVNTNASSINTFSLDSKRA